MLVNQLLVEEFLHLQFVINLSKNNLWERVARLVLVLLCDFPYFILNMISIQSKIICLGLDR